MKYASPTSACLTGLIVLQLVMLFAMLTQTAPHPPFTTPLFAMGPFLGLAIALPLCAILMGSEETVAGRAVALLAVIAALVSFGPQKWFDAQFHLIWPAVVSAQICIAIISVRVFLAQKATARTA